MQRASSTKPWERALKRSLRTIERSRVAILLAVSGITFVDIFLIGSASLLVHGVGDEIGHVLTAFLSVLAVRLVVASLTLVPALFAAVAIDLDHVPHLLGLSEPTLGTSRAGTHSLAIVAVLLILALIDRRRVTIWLSASVGLLSHLARDLARGTVMLWWPLSSTLVSIPYWTYVVLIFVLAMGALLHLAQVHRHSDGWHLVRVREHVPNGKIASAAFQRAGRDGRSR